MTRGRLPLLACFVLLAPPAGAGPPAAALLAGAVDLERFRHHVEQLSSPDGPTGGTRHWTQPGNAAALDYVEAELTSYGYAVERHDYLVAGTFPRQNLYATKPGDVRPGEMYIVSSHIDSINVDAGTGTMAPGADDDASGVALVLEAARVFAPPNVRSDVSIRFAFWNNEESGLQGSQAYVADRAGLQGMEEPPGSGWHPEPTWLGIVQHDMILFDHGLPPQPEAIPGADIDVEYAAASAFAGPSQQLAQSLAAANVAIGADHPVELGDDMQLTDSVSFQDHAAAVSVRENRRVAEIGNGSNPYIHTGSDVVASYSEADFRLGWSTARTTVAAVATLAGARIVPGIPDAGAAPRAALAALLCAVGALGLRRGLARARRPDARSDRFAAWTAVRPRRPPPVP